MSEGGFDLNAAVRAALFGSAGSPQERLRVLFPTLGPDAARVAAACCQEIDAYSCVLAERVRDEAISRKTMAAAIKERWPELTEESLRAVMDRALNLVSC